MLSQSRERAVQGAVQTKGLHNPISRDQIIKLGSKLAPAAVTLGRLRPLLSDPNTALAEVAALIRLDPALTFHVVRMSNSVLFGTHERNDTLDGAVGRVGFLEVYRLVGLAATNQLCQRDLGTYRLRAARLWENSVATAAAAEVLASRAGADAGLSYASGLLRNLGTVIIDAYSQGKVYPGEAEWPSVSEWERAVFGMTSAEVTAILLEHWRFPSDVVDAVRAHHDPLADSFSNLGACVLNLACGVSARFGLELPGERRHWVPTEAKLQLGGLTDKVLEECAENAQAHYVALCASVK